MYYPGFFFFTPRPYVTSSSVILVRLCPLIDLLHCISSRAIATGYGSSCRVGAPLLHLAFVRFCPGSRGRRASVGIVAVSFSRRSEQRETSL